MTWPVLAPRSSSPRTMPACRIDGQVAGLGDQGAARAHARATFPAIQRALQLVTNWRRSAWRCRGNSEVGRSRAGRPPEVFAQAPFGPPPKHRAATTLRPSLTGRTHTVIVAQ